jgi:hypothetical protein
LLQDPGSISNFRETGILELDDKPCHLLTLVETVQTLGENMLMHCAKVRSTSVDLARQPAAGGALQFTLALPLFIDSRRLAFVLP